LSRQEKEAKEGDRKPLAFGFPLLRRQNRETKRTRCAQTCFVSDPISAPQQRQRPKRISLQKQLQKRLQEQRQNAIVSYAARQKFNLIPALLIRRHTHDFCGDSPARQWRVAAPFCITILP
jgi:hypothetical protein